MPSYEYVCPNCGWAVSLKMTLEEYSRPNKTITCEKCDADLRRKFSPPAVSIK